MKEWFCKECGSRKRTEDNIIMKICKSCVVEMEHICFVCNEKAVDKLEVYQSNIDGLKYNYWFCSKHLNEHKEGQWQKQMT
jgi:hypothetical protein